MHQFKSIHLRYYIMAKRINHPPLLEFRACHFTNHTAMTLLRQYQMSALTYEDSSATSPFLLYQRGIRTQSEEDNLDEPFSIPAYP